MFVRPASARTATVKAGQTERIDGHILLDREATAADCLVWDLKQLGWLLGENREDATRGQYPLVLRCSTGSAKPLLIASVANAKAALEVLRSHADVASSSMEQMQARPQRKPLVRPRA